MATTRKKATSRRRTKVTGEVGRMLGQIEGRRRSARSKLWTETQPPNVKTGKVCM